MLKRAISLAVGGAALLAAPNAAAQAEVQQLGAQFWAWRAATQPATSDDIPRIVRPAQWTPDWSPAAVAAQQARLAAFEAEWKALAARPQTVSEKV
ncbi:MAG TPA: hypothetical protein VEZ59_09890, partial [Sphingopyxis sp.]|nr:hypothetical protein [Sphingopyxis sp.]